MLTKRKRRTASPATKARLKALRKAHGLGEFKSPAGSRPRVPKGRKYSKKSFSSNGYYPNPNFGSQAQPVSPGQATPVSIAISNPNFLTPGSSSNPLGAVIREGGPMGRQVFFDGVWQDVL